MASNIDCDFYSVWPRMLEQASATRKLLLKFFPRHLLSPLKFEIHMLLLRMSTLTKASKYQGQKNLLVNIGAGDAGKPDWVNIDAFKTESVNCVYDARKRLPFSDNSVKCIFSEHFIEHLDYNEEVPYFITECYRVLQKGGVIRIIVPDAEKYIRAYTKGGWDELVEMKRLGDQLRDPCFDFKYNTRMELINFVFRQWSEHKFAYDFETLKFVLKEGGFTNVKRQAFGKSSMAEILLDKANRTPESLYVEAIK